MGDIDPANVGIDWNDDPVPCSKCGCTEDKPCIDDDGIPCWWIDDGICSRCDEP